MRYRMGEHHGGGGRSALAFLAGAGVALIVAGYYLYGPNGPRHRLEVGRWLRRAKFEILDKMADLENITEDQYHRIVDEVMSRYGRYREMGSEKLEHAKMKFKSKWQEMREAAKRARDEAKADMEAEEREVERRIEQ